MDVTLPPVGVVEDGDLPRLQALPNAEAKAAASILRGTPGCFSADGLSLEAASWETSLWTPTSSLDLSIGDPFIASADARVMVHRR